MLEGKEKKHGEERGRKTHYQRSGYASEELERLRAKG
jgi:hypothetical protein